MPSERIGFIGVGAMGLPMAVRLCQAGYPVVFTSRRAEAVARLTAAGATALPTPLVVASESDIVLSCLPADDDLFEVFLGPDGVIERLRPGGTIIDLSTTSPMMIQRIADEAARRQIRVVDAPVSGGVTGAEQGTLTLMVGCAPEVLEKVRPLLAVLGSRVFHVGDVGMGKVFKLVNNLLTGATLVLIGEALALAASAEADLRLLYEVVKASSGNSNAWTDAVPKVLEAAERKPGFRLELMRKDLGLASAMGADLDVPLALTTLALQVYMVACSRGHGKEDAQQIARFVARLASVDLTRDT
ncbi:MAG: NAD(P)-dependent oxidoreductase [Sphaerobacter sp.]|nr:NAD(P)-dependent oxidoreductase [Sphaerobacter sp.]